MISDLNKISQIPKASLMRPFFGHLVIKYFRMRLIVILSVFTIIFISCKEKKQYIHFNGGVFGTTYHIIYSSDDTLDTKIKNALNEVNLSLSTYERTSVISKINNNDTDIVFNDHFLKVFNKGKKVSEITNGAFDMTVAPLVNLWGFGFSNREDATGNKVDSILNFVGFNKIEIESGKIIKTDSSLMIDASAIAKGYGVDVIAELFDSLGVNNYLVEIGGEIRVKGKNGKGKMWSIAIDKPIEDLLLQNREFQEFLVMTDKSLASSGNYRNFYYENGVKYAHTINPKTGYPAQTEILSASVIAEDCMSADAFATSFMVLGLDSAMKVAESISELEAYFICSGKDDEYDIHYTSGFKKYIKK